MPFSFFKNSPFPHFSLILFKIYIRGLPFYECVWDQINRGICICQSEKVTFYNALTLDEAVFHYGTGAWQPTKILQRSVGICQNLVPLINKDLLCNLEHEIYNKCVNAPLKYTDKHGKINSGQAIIRGAEQCHIRSDSVSIRGEL